MKKGFTLIELLLYVGILSFVLLVVSIFLAALLSANAKNQTIAEVEGQGLAAMQIITQALRNADFVNSPAAGTSAASLSINTIIPANNPTIFDLSGGNIRINEAGTTVVLNNSRVIVSGLSFSNLSRVGTPGIIRIQFTLTHANPDGRNEYNFSKTFTTAAALRWP